jgi:hypothetical protein
MNGLFAADSLLPASFPRIRQHPAAKSLILAGGDIKPISRNGIFWNDRPELTGATFFGFLS